MCLFRKPFRFLSAVSFTQNESASPAPSPERRRAVSDGCCWAALNGVTATAVRARALRVAGCAGLSPRRCAVRGRRWPPRTHGLCSSDSVALTCWKESSNSVCRDTLIFT